MHDGTPGSTPIALSEVEFGLDATYKSVFRCEPFVSLKPGKYTFFGEINGTVALDCDFRQEVAVIPAQNRYVTRGWGKLAVVYGTTGNKRTQVQGNIYKVKLTPSDRIKGVLTLYEFSESNVNSSYIELFNLKVSLSAATFEGDLATEVQYFYARDGYRYRAVFIVETNLSVPIDRNIVFEAV